MLITQLAWLLGDREIYPLCYTITLFYQNLQPFQLLCCQPCIFVYSSRCGSSDFLDTKSAGASLEDDQHPSTPAWFLYLSRTYTQQHSSLNLTV